MRSNDPRRRLGVLLSALVLLVAAATACSDDGGDTSSDTTAAESTTTEAETFDAGDAGSDEDAEKADEEQCTFADDFMSAVDDEVEALPDDTSYDGYTTISDETGALILEVPVEFTDVNGALNDEGLPQVDASPDLEGFVDTWDVSGVTYNSFGQETTGFSSSQEAFDSATGTGGVVEDSCTFDSSETFEEGALQYTVGYYLDCAGTDTDYGLVYIFLGADEPILSIGYQLTSVADGEAFENVLATFDYDRELL